MLRGIRAVRVPGYSWWRRASLLCVCRLCARASSPSGKCSPPFTSARRRRLPRRCCPRRPAASIPLLLPSVVSSAALRRLRSSFSSLPPPCAADPRCPHRPLPPTRPLWPAHRRPRCRLPPRRRPRGSHVATRVWSGSLGALLGHARLRAVRSIKYIASPPAAVGREPTSSRRCAGLGQGRAVLISR